MPVQFFAEAHWKQNIARVTEQNRIGVKPYTAMLVNKGHSYEVAFCNDGLDTIGQGKAQWLKSPCLIQDLRRDKILHCSRREQQKTISECPLHRDQSQRYICRHKVPRYIFPITDIACRRVIFFVHQCRAMPLARSNPASDRYALSRNSDGAHWV